MFEKQKNLVKEAVPMLLAFSLALNGSLLVLDADIGMDTGSYDELPVTVTLRKMEMPNPPAKEAEPEAEDKAVEPEPEAGDKKLRPLHETVHGWINRKLDEPGMWYRTPRTYMWCFLRDTVQELIDQGYEKALHISTITEIWISKESKHYFMMQNHDDRGCIFYYGEDYTGGRDGQEIN